MNGTSRTRRLRGGRAIEKVGLRLAALMDACWTKLVEIEATIRHPLHIVSFSHLGIMPPPHRTNG